MEAMPMGKLVAKVALEHVYKIMKEFSELIKNIEILRPLIREFFIFGFKSRKDFDKKSGKTYDNDKRRIVSIFNELCVSNYDKNGKKVSILINSDEVDSNPFYKLFKTKSFTDNDLVLHFLILDIFSAIDAPLSAMEFADLTHNYLEESIDLGVVRIKLNEYVDLGILHTTKIGNKIVYKLKHPFSDKGLDWDAIRYFSEVDVLGVIGSYILDRQNNEMKSIIKFKHRQLFGALDSSYILQVFDTIHSGNQLNITYKERGITFTKQALPLKIIINRQNGRQYLAAFIIEENKFFNFRLDHIIEVKINNQKVNQNLHNMLICELQERLSHTWNVNFFKGDKPQKVELHIYVDEGEEFILTRLKREGHGGKVIKVSDNEYIYAITLYDPTEIIPWVKSFIGRIISFHCEDQLIENIFYEDIRRLTEENEDEA